MVQVLAPVMAARRGRTAAPQPAFVAGCSCSCRSARAWISAAAPRAVTPGFRRPVTRRVRPTRSAGSASGVRGVHTSISPRVPISIAGASTPITRWGSPSSRRVRPTTAGIGPELARPEAVAQEGDALPLRGGPRRAGSPAAQRLEAPFREQAGGDREPAHPHRVARAREVVGPSARRGQVLE